MNKSTIGHKIQALAKVVLIFGLIQSAFTLITAASLVYDSIFTVHSNFSISVGIFPNQVFTGILSIISSIIWPVIRPFILFFCLKGFGHLLINSDELFRIKTEELKGQQFVINLGDDKTGQE